MNRKTKSQMASFNYVFFLSQINRIHNIFLKIFKYLYFYYYFSVSITEQIIYLFNVIDLINKFDTYIYIFINDLKLSSEK